jgi:tetratricopeptide (TPR) repeat protein
MLTSQKIMAVPYQLNLVDEIIQFISGHPDFLAAPAIHGYYRVARLLTQDQASEDFAALKALIHQQSAHIPPQILEELYQYAINYCHLQIRKFDDQQPHVAEALELYIQAIETGVLLQQGHISPGNFKNIIKLSLIQQQYDWTEQFILRYSRLLDPDYREDALHYNLAELYYSTNRPDEAMIHLNQVEFSDLQYNLGAKVLLSRIYYETGAVDALESLLHAFKTYLHRNRVITQETRRLYLNFIRFLSAIVRSTPETRERIRGKLEQTSQVTLKKWLLSIL